MNKRIEKRLKEICSEIAEDKEFIIGNFEVGEQDHVHVFVSAHPKIAPSYIVKMLKGITARKLFIEFPELKRKCWKCHLWNSSFYVETIGSISEEVIRQYIQKQQKGG